MTAKTEALFHEVLALPEDELAELMHRIVQNLEAAGLPVFDDEFLSELDRRANDGPEHFEDASAVFERVRASLANRPKP